MLGGRISLPRLRELVVKEFRQTLRDPRAKRIMFIAPVMQLMLFGYAVNTDVRNAPTVVVDHDRTTVSRELVQVLTATGYFRVVERSDRPSAIADALDHGRAVIGVEIPRGFAADLGAGRAAVQVIVDGTSSNTGTVAQGYANQIIQRFGIQKQRESRRAGGWEGTVAVDFRARAWYNPNLLSRVYNVPGVIGTIVMLMSLLLTALAVVRERELGTLEQLMVSPLTPQELILGKTVPAVVVAFVDLALVASIAILWFDIPLRGSPPLLLLGSFFYILAGLGLGLLISTISNTQQEAFMSMFFFFFPAIILSGFMYPIENMPRVVQWLTLADPIRHYLIIVRGVFLKGAGLEILWPQITALAAMGTTVVFVAASRFRKTIA
jgi:ABC-2 type transport system permease protein